MWLPQYEGCVGVVGFVCGGVCLFVGGDLFKVHTQALKGNEFSTLLFATILMLEAIVIDLLAVSERALFRHHR